MSTDSNDQSRPESPERLSDFLRQVVAAFRDEERSDAELLAGFVQRSDQDAFRALIGRHGRSVWAVCLAQLGNAHDAEDAFQAAFMALARRASRIDARSGVGAWIRTAARLAARKVHRGANRLHRLRDRVASANTSIDERPTDESHAWVLAAEELERLPRRIREPLVMYHMEGRTLAQIAELLGCSIAAAHRRVNQGMERLRDRLSARGVALTAGLLAAMPTGLMTNTALAAVALAQGLPLPSQRVAALTQAILAPRFPSWWVAVGVTILLAAGTAAALVAYPTSNLPQVAIEEPNAKLPPAIAVDKPTKLAGRATANLNGRVTDAQGKPVAGASVSALVRRPWAPGDRGLRDDVAVKVTTDADGRYAMTVPADFATHYPERSITLLVSGPGLPTTTKLVWLGVGGVDIGVPATRTVSGVCVGPDGKPAPGVKLGVVRLGNAAVEPVQGREPKLPDGWPNDVISEKDGSFSFAGLPTSEDAWVEVRDDRFAMTTVRFAASESKPMRIALEPPRFLEGRVTAADSGKPLPGARVSVFVGHWEAHSQHYTAILSDAAAAIDAAPVELDALSGPDGEFRFRLPPHGPYRVFVHPPAEAPYLSVYRSVSWRKGRLAHELPVSLPPGRIVRGVMKEEDGTPVAGGWVYYCPSAGNRHVTGEVLINRDSAVRTASDGSFAIAIPPGRGSLHVWGPTPDYLPKNRKVTRVLDPNIVGIDVDRVNAPEPLSIVLKRGVSLPVRVIGPKGEPVNSGLAVCRSVVHPMRNKVPRVLPVRDGAFQLPGCDPGRVYSVVVLDPERGWGAAAEVRVGAAVPTTRLEPLGSAEVRLTDAESRALSDANVTLMTRIAFDRPAEAGGENEPEQSYLPQSWLDVGRTESSLTGQDGRVVLRNLVPGVKYMARFTLGERVYVSGSFRVNAGEKAQLPDVIAGKAKSDKPDSPDDMDPED